ncbi:MAG: SDR family oxidoreductase [Tepidisphaera sp.]|nr:SDR family oxidoreductase [Tepidisphaera sp.]
MQQAGTPSTTQPASPPLSRDQQWKLIQQSSPLLLILLLVAIAAIVVALVTRSILKASRARQARLDRAADQDAAKVPKVDPWTESARRMTIDKIEGAPAPAGAQAPPPVPKPDAPRPLALITGAARRVGRAVALELARRGCDVLFTFNASEEDAISLAKELAAMGATASFFRLDLADADAVESFASERAETLKRLDILVHNASVYDPSPLTDVTPDQAMHQYRINALAPLMLTARLAPLLEASVLPGGGSVVAMVDIHSMGRPRKDFAVYSMSKAALAEMVQCLARDLAPHVRVNGVAPGVVAWPESGEESEPEAQKKYTRRIPLERAGTPEDAARTVRWLALEATYVTGEIIRVDGGRWLT